MRDLNRRIEHMSIWRDKMFKYEWAAQKHAEQMQDKLYMAHITSFSHDRVKSRIYMNSLEPRQEIVIPELFRLKIE